MWHGLQREHRFWGGAHPLPAFKARGRLDEYPAREEYTPRLFGSVINWPKQTDPVTA